MSWNGGVLIDGNTVLTTFTHYKSISNKSLSPDIEMRYPPYKGNLKWVDL